MTGGELVAVATIENVDGCGGPASAGAAEAKTRRKSELRMPRSLAPRKRD